MLRIYCDSNIYRYLKPVHPSFSNELLKTFESLKDKMAFTFSEAHLDDLKNSDYSLALKDLELMEVYVKDNYFQQSGRFSQKTSCYLKTPSIAFREKNHHIYNKIIENNVSDLDTLFPENESDIYGYEKLLKDLLNSIYSIPIATLISSAFIEDNSINAKKILDKMIPNYNAEISLRDVIKDMSPFIHSLMTDPNELASLRKYINEYTDRNEYSFEKWGPRFNQMLKQTNIEKSFTETIDSLLIGDQKEDMYQRFKYTYTLLEIYNITQERSGKQNKLKKFTLDSLNIDASHAWFASFSDYLITDDKGLQVKAAITYSLLGVTTKILSSKDFINSQTLLNKQEENLFSLFNSILYDLENAMLLHSIENNNERVYTFKTGHSYFNYANRIQKVERSTGVNVTIYCDRESSSIGFMYRELEILTYKLINILGLDDDNKGAFHFEERESVKWNYATRTWTLAEYTWSIGISDKAPGRIYINIYMPKT